MCLLRTAIPVAILCLVGPSASADERSLEFIERLRDRGYHDIVVEYVESIRNSPQTPEVVRTQADYFVGKSLMAGAEAISDLEKRDLQLQSARTRLARFIEQHPDHERVADARMDQAQVLVERGRVALLHAENPNNESRRQEYQGQARVLYDAARESFTAARDQLAAEFKKYAPFIPEDQRRLREAKAAAQVGVMQAHLHMGLVEYEYAQSFDKSNANQKSSLEKAVEIFESVRQQYRFLLGGQYARMWQGKCYEEMGELGKAEGIYKELLEHDNRDAAMRALQRRVQFFQIIVLNKRGDHILAADLAAQWLQENAVMRNTETGLGVLFEQAKGLLQQATSRPAASEERNRYLKQAVDALAIVARYDTIYKQPAIVLQQKYRGLIGANAAVLTFDNAVALGDDAKDRNAWPEAAQHYAEALRLARDSLDGDQLAFLRYKLSFAYFQTSKFYESAVLGEYVARRQRESKFAAPAAHTALEAYARVFNDMNRREQSTEYEETRIVRLVEFVKEQWPDTAEANAALLLLGDLHRFRGRLEQAAMALQSLSQDAPDYCRALSRSGEAFWQLYVEETRKTPDERDVATIARALKSARENLANSVASWQKRLKPGSAVPVELATAIINLAEVSIENGQAADAINLLNELVPKAQAQSDLKPLEIPALVALLRAAIAAQNLPAAESTMKEIEATGKDVAEITRAYLDLGKQLQAEMGRLNAQGDEFKAHQTRYSYVTFLNQMASRRAGQTFLTLQWTGEAFFGLEMFDQAAERFGEIVQRTMTDPQFLDQSKPQNRAALVQAKLRYVTSLRKQKRFSEAWEQIKPVRPQSNTGDDPLHVAATTNLDIILERGMILEEWGATVPDHLKTAIEHWVFWGQQLERISPRPPQYWEVRLGLLRCLLARARKPADAGDRSQRLKQAEQQLLVLTKTSYTLGGPSFRPQFKQLQKELEKELGRPLGGPPPATNPTVRS